MLISHNGVEFDFKLRGQLKKEREIGNKVEGKRFRVKDCHGPACGLCMGLCAVVRRIRRRKVDQGCYLHTIQHYLQTGAEAALSTVWYLQGPMPKLVIYTARLSTHYFTLQTNQNGHMAAFLDAGVPCLSVLPETCLPIPVWLQLPLTSFLRGGSIRLPKSPTCTCSAGCAGLAVVRNVIMEISPKVPVPKSCNVEALRANTTSAAFFPPKSQE